jgi:tRNA (cmo5U34)-methyltransferase
VAEDAHQFHFDPGTYLQSAIAEIPSYEEMEDRAAAATEGIDARSILDLGVGTGETAVRVQRKHPTARLSGIDESAGMLAYARRRLPTADLRVGRLEDPLPEGPFDLIVTALTVHHLDGPGKASLFARMTERLATGGRFVMADVITPEDPDDVVTPIDGVFDQPSSTEDLLAWLGDAGLDARVVWVHGDLAVIVAEHRT